MHMHTLNRITNTHYTVCARANIYVKQALSFLSQWLNPI